MSVWSDSGGSRRRMLGSVVARWCLFGLLPLLVVAQPHVPRFEDFPVSGTWSGPNAPVRLSTSSERMFRTRLGDAAKKPPDFAGHYRFAGWGCGSACAAGAIIDLRTGDVFPPLMGGNGKGSEHWIFTGGIVEGPYVEYRRDSRLVLVRQQAQDPAMQELHYFEWVGTGFRKILQLTQKKPIVSGERAN